MLQPTPTTTPLPKQTLMRKTTDKFSLFFFTFTKEFAVSDRIATAPSGQPSIRTKNAMRRTTTTEVLVNGNGGSEKEDWRWDGRGEEESQCLRLERAKFMLDKMSGLSPRNQFV